MITFVRILLIALTFAVTQVVLASTVIVPALAQTEKSPQTNASPGTAPTTPVKKRFYKPDDAITSDTTRERMCGQNGGQCYADWILLTHPQDASYQGRLRLEKNYRDCMARCKAIPGPKP